tara:strand:- start:11364 stop:11984 length:621 start_codon:yes stop_codon:yes gene_type:complete
MAKEGKAEIVIISDRSGSMGGIASDMEGGIKEFLKEQKEDNKGEINVTFTQFDDEYEVVFENKPIAEVEDITIRPRGGTALLDAIGKTISSVSERISELAEENQPERVLFIIITDGYENSSREYNKEQITDLISTNEETNGWDFTFLGANLDAIAEGGRIGVSASKSLNYAASSAGVQRMTRSISKYAKDYLATGDAEYDESDREE